MPTYEYACQGCDHQFEQFQSIKDEPLVQCPKCKKKKLKRLVGSGAGLIFKGSGFYITDYRSEGYKTAAKKESGGGEKKEAKPAEKSGASSPSPASAPSKPASGGSSSGGASGSGSK